MGGINIGGIRKYNGCVIKKLLLLNLMTVEVVLSHGLR